MNRTLKTLLLWLLMAVLPLNAVAAAMGISCSAVHDQMAMAASAHAAKHQAGHSAVTGHDSAGAHSAHHDGGHEMSKATAVSDGGHGMGHSTCSACSAFCVGAVAPPPAVIPASISNSSEIVLISPAALGAGFIPDGHKRPPRHLSV